MSKLTLKIILTVILSLPTAFFLMFLFGEVFAGDMSGFSHILQALPFIIGIVLVWKWPKTRKKSN